MTPQEPNHFLLADLNTLNNHPQIGACPSPPCPIAISGAISGVTVVWAESASTDAVMEWENPYNPWLLASGPTNQIRVGITLDGSNAYWSNSDGTIMRVSLTGVGAVMLASGQGTPGGIAIDATSVYWTNSSSGTVMKLTPR